MTVLVNPYRFAASGPTTLVYDTFTDSDATAITAHTPDTDTVGGGWLNSGITIQSNRAFGKATGGGQAWVDCGESDVTMTATGRGGVNNYGPGLAGRVTDATNYWFSILLMGGAHRLYERVAGSYTQRATSSANTWTINTDYSMQLVFSGTSITSTCEGDEISYTSSLYQTNTKHGMRLDGNNSLGSTIDNLTVTG